MGAAASSQSRYEIGSELIRHKENAPLRGPDLQLDGSLETRDEYHEKYNHGAGNKTFVAPRLAPAPVAPRKTKEKTDLEIQAEAHWHRILMHAKSRDEARESKANGNRPKSPLLDIRTNVDEDTMRQTLLESGYDEVGKSSTYTPPKGKAVAKEETSESNPKTKTKGKGQANEPEKAKFNPFDFLRGKLKRAKSDNSDMGKDSDDDSYDDDDVESCFDSELGSDDDIPDDEEGKENDEYLVYKGPITLPELTISLKSRTSTTITLNWDVDIAAMAALNEIHETVGYNYRPKYEIAFQIHIRDDSAADPSAPNPNTPWTTATTTTRAHGGTVKGLLPNTPYVFKAKRVGWDDDFNSPVVIRTGPGPPMPPVDMKFKEVTSNSILIAWQYPEKDNGLPVNEYVVSMKPWGGNFETVYRGKNRLYLATSLNANTVYTFELRARNKAGESGPSERVSVRTLPPGSPNMTPWVEFIDEKTSRICYSHPSTGAVAWELPSGGLIDESESFRFKRIWLQRHMHSKSLYALDKIGKDTHANTLIINRSAMLEQSLQKLFAIDPVDLEAGPIKVNFENEEGLDAGGLGKDWFAQVAKLLRSTSSGLFTVLPSGDITIDPRSSVILNSYEVRWLYKAVGIFMAKAIMDGQTLGLSLSPLLLSHLAGITPTFEDLEKIEPQYYRGLQYIRENDVADMELTFTVAFELFDEQQTVELKPYGISEAVTQQNKGEYISLMVDWLVRKRFEPGLTNLLEGFQRHISPQDLSKFRLSEIQAILGGRQSVDHADIIVGARFSGGFSEDSEQITWLFRALEDLDQVSLSKFLAFTTGCPHLPIDGLKPTLLITLDEEGSNGSLPKAHTCFNQLVIPEYSSQDVLVERLTFALENTAEGFHIT